MLPDEKPPVPAVQAFRTVLMLAQRLRYLMDDRLREDGLTTQQAALVTAVAALGRPSLKEAAAVLSTTHQNIAQLAAALERKGMLRSVPDPGDGRRRLLETTELNEDYWRRRNEADHAAVEEWFGTLSLDEQVTLCALTSRVLGGL